MDKVTFPPDNAYAKQIVAAAWKQHKEFLIDDDDEIEQDDDDNTNEMLATNPFDNKNQQPLTEPTFTPSLNKPTSPPQPTFTPTYISQSSFKITPIKTIKYLEKNNFKSEIIEKFTQLGLEIEDLVDSDPQFIDKIVNEIFELQQKDADKLKQCIAKIKKLRNIMNQNNAHKRQSYDMRATTESTQKRRRFNQDNLNKWDGNGYKSNYNGYQSNYNGYQSNYNEHQSNYNGYQSHYDRYNGYNNNNNHFHYKENDNNFHLGLCGNKNDNRTIKKADTNKNSMNKRKKRGFNKTFCKHYADYVQMKILGEDEKESTLYKLTSTRGDIHHKNKWITAPLKFMIYQRSSFNVSDIDNLTEIKSKCDNKWSIITQNSWAKAAKITQKDSREYKLTSETLEKLIGDDLRQKLQANPNYLK